MDFGKIGNTSSRWPEQVWRGSGGAWATAAAREKGHGREGGENPPPMLNTLSSVSVPESRIQYLCDPQWFMDTAIRGPTTIVAPESQFRTCPSDHDRDQSLFLEVRTSMYYVSPSSSSEGFTRRL
ncbi:hypothetical protein F511_05773 [Dorcoceras hygrometricum]|uniref:Uncharacterized protein n=1 Tax=Dorcoceras hygrometricum TaxID=472368 RepID=A0A2Z7BQ46_9LAMI|nr:hypothetical protein F511_05773 [Dorcoceras hygrometricum]